MRSRYRASAAQVKVQAAVKHTHTHTQGFETGSFYAFFYPDSSEIYVD